MKEKNDNGSSKKKSVRVSTALISEVFALKKIGIPAKDVALELGISEALAKRIWNKCNIKSGKKPRVKDITGSTSRKKTSSEKNRGTKKASNVETVNDGIMKLGVKDITGSTLRKKTSSEKSRGTKKASNVETVNDGIMKLGAKDVQSISKSTKKKTSSEKSRGTKKTSNVETVNDGIMKLGAKDVQRMSKSTKKPRGKTKKSASTGKSTTRGKAKKAGNGISKKEKVDYCNRVYGKGTWRFMTKREFVEYMMAKIEMNSDLRY